MRKELEALVKAVCVDYECDEDWGAAYIYIHELGADARQALVPVEPVAWEAGGVARLDCGACGMKLPEAANYCHVCGKAIKKG